MNPIEISFITRIHHIGIATYCIEKTEPFYLALGYANVARGYDPYQNVYGSFYTSDNMPTIELLAPYDENSPINTILKKSGVGPYHICYEVNIPLPDAIQKMKELKFLQISKPTISDNLNKRKVVFFFHKDVGIVELVENGA